MAAGEGETTQCFEIGERECGSLVKDAGEHAEPRSEACKRPVQEAGEGVTEH